MTRIFAPTDDDDNVLVKHVSNIVDNEGEDEIVDVVVVVDDDDDDDDD